MGVHGDTCFRDDRSYKLLNFEFSRSDRSPPGSSLTSPAFSWMSEAGVVRASPLSLLLVGRMCFFRDYLRGVVIDLEALLTSIPKEASRLHD